MSKWDKRVLAGLIAFVMIWGVGVMLVRPYLTEDYRSTRECPNSYWTCSTRVEGVAELGDKVMKVPFNASARSCVQNGAWERSSREARYNCTVSGLVDPETCDDVDTKCELPKARLYDL